jgi:hypothetical protein
MSELSISKEIIPQTERPAATFQEQPLLSSATALLIDSKRIEAMSEPYRKVRALLMRPQL